MRVLHILPHARALGGTERTVLDLLASPDLAHVEQRVLFVQPGHVRGFSREDVLGTPAGEVLPGGALPALARWRPDIVHGWLLQGNALGAMLKPLLRDVALITSERHSHDVLTRAQRGLERLVARAEDIATANSSAVRAAAIHRQPQRAARFRVIAPGVASLPEPPGGPRSCSAVMVGRIHPVKDHATALRAWRRVVDQRPDATLTIVGGGHGLGAVRRFAESLALDGSVRFRGEGDPAPDVHGARMLLSTSRSEGFSRAVIEALASGVPVVSTAVGGTAELPDDAVRVAPVGDDAGLAQHVLAWLADTGALLSAQAAARAAAAQFPPHRCHAAYARMYAEIANGA